MVIYALDDLDDALAVTRAFLAPFDRTAWLKLAVVAFFVGGPGANLNAVQFNVPAGDGAPPPGGVGPPDLGPDEWLVVAAVVGLALLVALALALVGAIMEFVLVESLRSREVAIRRYWGRRWRQGVRLFGFRIAIALFALASTLVLAGLFALPLVVFDAAAPGIVALVVLLPVFVALGVVVGLVDGFTTVFVVPIMVLADCGVLAGWRRLWPTVVAQWEQYLAYAVAGVLLSVVGAVLVALVAGVLALVLLVPFGILFAVGVALFAAVEPLGLGLLVVTGLLYGLAVLVVVALVQAPVLAYLRYYALLVLGDVDPDLDLVPAQRAAVRE